MSFRRNHSHLLPFAVLVSLFKTKLALRKAQCQLTFVHEKMANKLILLFCCCYCISLTCHAAIWKTEDAYIIDDLPEEDTQEFATTDRSNVCVDSNGAQGQCVSTEDCNGHLQFFEHKTEVLNGMQQYLNGTDLEPCTPDESITTNSANYVCCTSLKYTNAKSITLDEYNAKFPNEITQQSEILPATLDTNAVVSNIVNGQEARVGEFPFAVAIIYRGQQICGGSLIDSQYVLSAAHCFDKFNPGAVRQLVIRVGAHHVTEGSQHLVSKLYLHPGFFRQKGFFKDDVALIKLKTPVSGGGNVRTVALHTGSPSINGPFDKAVVAGWGRICSAMTCPQSQVLRKTMLDLVSNSECARKYAGTQAPPLTQNMVCAGGTGGMDACNGDSGGPLVIYANGQTYQIGIVSWGIGCGTYPGVYTRVSSFTSWVTKHKLKP